MNKDKTHINNKNVVNVIINNPLKNKHKKKKSYQAPQSIPYAFTNMSNLQTEALRNQLANAEGQNPNLLRANWLNRFRDPNEADMIKMGNNDEVVDVHSEADDLNNRLYNVYGENPSYDRSVLSSPQSATPRRVKIKPLKASKLTSKGLGNMTITQLKDVARSQGIGEEYLGNITTSNKKQKAQLLYDYINQPSGGGRVRTDKEDPFK